MSKMFRLSFVLLLITAVTGIILGGVQTITAEPIRLTKEREHREALEITLPGATEFKMLKIGTDPKGMIKEINIGTAGSELVGYNFNVLTKGYGGLMELVVGIGKEGQVKGIKILVLNETPGLGGEATAPKFLNQFKNKIVQKFDVIKTPSNKDTQIQAISGATITSDAVVDGVNDAVDFWNKNFKEEGVK